MRRFASLLGATVVVLALTAVSGAAADGGYDVRNCSHGGIFCAEPYESIGYDGGYTGHDEPSLAFYSSTPGSGNSARYRVQLPTDPKKQPKQGGGGATWSFQLGPAFWFGMALCDNQSSPEFTHAPCTPDSDANVFDGTDPAAPDYIGKHPGTAFLEVQFYPPGWVPLPAGLSCDRTRWCAAMAIFSFNQDQNSGAFNNDACLGAVGPEPASYAFVTRSGVPHAPPDPLGVVSPPFSALTPNPATDLFMNPGDVLALDIHDSPAGLVVAIDDLTTHQSGSMTASAANGFAHVLYDPASGTCDEEPYTYRPMYATSSEHTRVPWEAHAYNVAASGELGHFEYCDEVDEDTGLCLANAEGDVDADDNGCFGPEDSLLARVGGCAGFNPTDGDFDGESYTDSWAGSGRKADDKEHPTPFVFTSPLFNGDQNYSRVAFEANLPRIEAPDSGGTCNVLTGQSCVNPPPGSSFYPIYTAGTATKEFAGKPGKARKGGCVWQFGGPDIKGTTNDFGGDSAAEFGPLLFSFYPHPNPARRLRANNFRQVLDVNPCPAPTG